MSNHKLAIAHCVHHKPWLITSSVISTHAQSNQDFHTFFLINEGHERDLSEGTYKEEYERYLSIRDKNIHFSKSTNLATSVKSKNTQLDSFDQDVRKFCDLQNGKSSIISFENDHGLDSGAWLKFIKSGEWRSFDSTLFMGEGSLLARCSALNELVEAIEMKDLNFITGSQDKRFLPRDRWTQGFASVKVKGEMSEFHNEMIKKTYEIFLRDPEFQKVYQLWPIGLPIEVDNLVPKVWGPSSKLMRFIDSTNIYNFLNFMIPPSEEISSRFLRNQKLINGDNIESLKVGRMNLYKEAHIGWYGACCNHLISRAILERLSDKLDKYSMYDVLDLPYSATALEQIWGLIPFWLGTEPWFTDGIHRVRKNFFTYRREDNPKIMVRYLNRYFNDAMKVEENQGKVFLKKLYNSDSKLKELPDIYKCSV